MVNLAALSRRLARAEAATALWPAGLAGRVVVIDSVALGRTVELSEHGTPGGYSWAEVRRLVEQGASAEHLRRVDAVKLGLGGVVV